MAKKPQKPTIVITFDEDKFPTAIIKQFEKMTPAMIDRGFEEAQTVWNRMRSQAVMEANKGNLKKPPLSEIDKPKEKEPENA